jgi:hypothetical protein
MPELQPETEVPQSWLVAAVARNGTVVYEAGWRHREANGALKTMKRRLGPAWLERDDDGGLRRRRGRPKPGFLDEPAAIVAKDRLVRTVEHQLAERADAAERKANAPATFREVAAAYLVWLDDVRDAKPSTLREHRYLLVEPGTPYRRGKGTHTGTIMALLGDRPASEITTREINGLLAMVANTGVSPRTVNKHRQLISAIFGFACQEATFDLPKNPATASDRRTEPEPARLDFYSSEEVEALARSLETGLHRDPNAPRSAKLRR